MPATSEKQKRLMDAAAHNPAFAKKVGMPQNVAKDFSEASKGMKFGSGARTRVDRQAFNKPKTDHGASALFKEGGDMKKDMKALFAGKEAKAEEKAEKKAFPTKAGYKKAEAKFEGEKMAKGGSTSLAKHASMPASKAHAGLKTGGFTRSADGIATKGKTKATQVTMKRGGKC